MAEEEARPPFVRFETRSEENRDATIKAGHYVGNDVDYAFVTPRGTKDQLVYKVEDWFRNLREATQQERVPSHWLPAFERAYKDWKEGRETPEKGSPVKDWPGASPSQIKTLLDIGVRTVEELAEANEETLQRVGMGGHALKEKAKNWLKASESKGKVTEELTQLKTENAELRTQVDELMKRLEAVEKARAEENA